MSTRATRVGRVAPVGSAINATAKIKPILRVSVAGSLRPLTRMLPSISPGPPVSRPTVLHHPRMGERAQAQLLQRWVTDWLNPVLGAERREQTLAAGLHKLIHIRKITIVVGVGHIVRQTARGKIEQAGDLMAVGALTIQATYLSEVI